MPGPALSFDSLPSLAPFLSRIECLACTQSPEREPAMNYLIAPIVALATPLAFAHEGHGIEGSHGHATDAVGLVVALVAVAAAIWFGRNK
jgi:hypothetical protein